MLSQGLNETEIAKRLNVDQSTISRDIKSIKKESMNKIESIMEDVLPYEYSKSILSMEQIIRRCWIVIDDNSTQWTNKNKLDALKLLKEATVTKFEILNQGPVTLRVVQLEEKVKDVAEEEQTSRKSFFKLGPPLDDLR